MRSASKTLSEPKEYGASHTPGIPMELTDKISAVGERKTPDQSFEHRQSDTCAESNLLNGNPKAEGCNHSSNERQSKRLHQLKNIKSCFFADPSQQKPRVPTQQGYSEYTQRMQSFGSHPTPTLIRIGQFESSDMTTYCRVGLAGPPTIESSV